MEIKIYGPGCSKCKQTLENAKKAVNQSEVKADVEKIFDQMAMIKKGITSPPALVIDDKIVFSGRIPEVEEIKDKINN